MMQVTTLDCGLERMTHEARPAFVIHIQGTASDRFLDFVDFSRCISVNFFSCLAKLLWHSRTPA